MQNGIADKHVDYFPTNIEPEQHWLSHKADQFIVLTMSQRMTKKTVDKGRV